MIDKSEQTHFAECQEIIRENIRIAEEKVIQGRKETADLHKAVSSGDVELYNQLIVSKDLLFHNENLLRKNKAALVKPYFGRVDYTEEGSGIRESLYIGKNGVSKNRTEVVVVDWRAPVSTLYYENELGRGSYDVPGMLRGALAEKIYVDLQLKRTFDVGDGELLGYFDNDAAATDQLLVKYLSQNKDVVLGDIISTIQKEQNEIIRESPYVDIIVQGVAGSGKTTVAMHRISYILYNYENRFAPSGFCIIGSNDMLLNYITSGLPELDVHNVGQKRMDFFLRDLLEKDWKKDYKLIDIPKEEAYKSSMEFVLELEAYLLKCKNRILPCEDIKDERNCVLLSGDSIADTLHENLEFSVVQLAKLLNERLQKRIAFLFSEEEQRSQQKELKAKYKGYFKLPKEESSLVEIYEAFLREYELVHGESLDQTAATKRKSFHVYDLAALALIRKRMLAKDLTEEYSQIIIDEAQDFGTMIYYVLKQVLYQCHFTIMGDVSQNINYDTGMNSWDAMQTQVFSGERTHFHILAKSYRNTIEISEYAGRILEKASFGAYKITPVIRHGREVDFYAMNASDKAMAEKTVEILAQVKERGYDTAAVICRDEKEAEEVRALLKLGEGEHYFSKGVMVLPIQLTKGLEFDAVLLWNPSSRAYGENEAEAKLLYVAVTRALHELHIVYNEELSPLFEL